MIPKEEILALPEIPRSEFKLLWYSNYWDGMLSGMLLYKGKKYWYSYFDEVTDYAKWDEEKEELEDLGWYRKFAIIEMNQEQIDKAEYWHDLFFKYVAVYSTFDENEELLGKEFPIYKKQGIQCSRGARPPELHHIYYDAYKKEFPDNMLEDEFKIGKIIGWFHN